MVSLPAAFLCALLVLSGTEFGGSFAAASMSIDRVQGGWIVSVPTSAASNSTVGGTVEGGPPPAGGAPAPFAIFVELNGWPHKTGVAIFNPDTGKWEFDIDVPPGSAGSSMRVTLVPDVGTPSVTTVKIT